MPKHKELGTNGEQIAVNFLKNKHYAILHCNWRCERKEVDIVAETENNIVFIEVKTRSNFDFGFPEEAVDERKKNHLKWLAEKYFEAHPSDKNIRFDIISIFYPSQSPIQILHIEDAFY